jgi:hypothetical protein
MKTFKVLSANPISKQGIAPFIGITVEIDGTEVKVARTYKQALLDLHKSARGANIPAGIFDNGVERANPLTVNAFHNAIIGLAGKFGFADMETYEAGTDYVVEDYSTAYKNGTATLGATLQREKAGTRIEGFMVYPLSDTEIARQEAIASLDPTMVMNALFGITAPVVNVVTPSLGNGSKPAEKASPNAMQEEVESDLHDEAFGVPTVEEQEPEQEFPAHELVATAKTNKK